MREKKIPLRLVPSYVGVNLTDSTTSMGDVYHWVHWHISFLKSIGTCRDLAMAQHVKNPQKLMIKWFQNVGPSKHVLGFAWNVQRFALEQCWHRSSTNQHNFQIVKGNCKWGSLCVCVLRCFMIYAADMFRFFAKYTCKHMCLHANTCLYLYIWFCIHYFHVCWRHQNKHIKNFQSTKLQRASFDHGDEMSCLYASRPHGWVGTEFVNPLPSVGGDQQCQLHVGVASMWCASAGIRLRQVSGRCDATGGLLKWLGRMHMARRLEYSFATRTTYAGTFVTWLWTCSGCRVSWSDGTDWDMIQRRLRGIEKRTLWEQVRWRQVRHVMSVWKVEKSHMWSVFCPRGNGKMKSLDFDKTEAEGWRVSHDKGGWFEDGMGRKMKTKCQGHLSTSFRSHDHVDIPKKSDVSMFWSYLHKYLPSLHWNKTTSNRFELRLISMCVDGTKTSTSKTLNQRSCSALLLTMGMKCLVSMPRDLPQAGGLEIFLVLALLPTSTKSTLVRGTPLHLWRGLGHLCIFQWSHGTRSQQDSRNSELSRSNTWYPNLLLRHTHFL